MGRRDYAGGAVPTTLSSSLSNVATVAACVALTNWPDGLQGPFSVTLGRGTPKEEKILCDQILNGTELSILQRGYDGTTAQDHSATTTVEHTITAIDADEANGHVNASVGVHGLPANTAIVGTDNTQTLKGKTLDFSPTGGKNVATNLPLSAMPEADNAIATEAQNRMDEDALIRASVAQETQDRQSADNNEAQLRITGDNARYTKAEVDAFLLVEQPTGAVQAFAGAVAPAGWILCDGRAVSKDTYPALFALIGTTFGGTGLPNFNVPDLRGKGILGGGGAKPLASTGGADTHVIGATNLPPHAHTINHDHTPNPTTSSDTHSHTINTYTGTSGTTAGRPQEVSGGSGSTVTTASDTHTHTVDIPTYNGNSGNGPGTSVPLETLDPFLVLNYIIRAR